MKKSIQTLVVLTSSLFLLTSSLLAAVPFKLGVARFTVHKMPFDKTLEMLEKLDCHYLGLPGGAIEESATDAEIAAFKAKCAAKGVEVVSAGPLYYKDEATLKSCVEFAVRCGMKYISVVPYEVKPGEEDKWGPGRQESEAMLDLLEKYVKKYDIRAAIHNHGPDCANLYPTAEAALKRIAGRDKRIGVCLDIGHEMRAGLDPVEFIRKHGDRIYEVHIKNILLKKDKNGFAGNFAVPGPRGDLDIPAIVKALADVGFGGYALIEYERDFDDNLAGLAESVGYYRGVMDSVKAKAVMKPVPEGANTLSAAEKAEGYELLFDGKNLPTDKWVGVKNGCKEFPAIGWFVKDGALTMRPMFVIKDDGTWGDLPPEDKKLGGAGDIVTANKYRNFIFKFDFRMTAKANSGVKYFYDEKTDSASCEEYQILDSGHPDFDKGKNGNRQIAALYDLIPAKGANDVVKPLGEWNSGMIVAKDDKIEHWLNGVKVVEYVRGSEDFRKIVQGSKYATWGKDAAGAARPWGENAEGRLLLQDHTDSTVSFCNLKVKAL